MPKFVSLLRGINVSGHRPIKMAALVQLFRSLSFEQVRTYIQSGNVVFSTGRRSPRALERDIARGIESQFGHDVSVLVRSDAQWSSVIKGNPFPEDPVGPFVTFLETQPDSSKTAKLKRIQLSPGGAYKMVESEIYILKPDGYSACKMTNNAIESALEVASTTRNWKTVCRLAEMLESPPRVE